MEAIETKERTEKRSISMPPRDWRAVEEYGSRRGLDVSSTVRMLLRTHPELVGRRDGQGQ